MTSPAIETKRDRLAWRVQIARELLDKAAALAFSPESKPSMRRQRLRDYENAKKYLADHEAALEQYYAASRHFDESNQPAGDQSAGALK